MYKLCFKITVGLGLALVSHTGSIAQTAPKVIKESHAHHASVYDAAMVKKVQQILATNEFTAFDDLQTQKLDRIEENSEVKITVGNPAATEKPGNQMYYHLQESTLVVGSSYLCSKCPEVHLINASAFVIHEDGIIVTNFHVIEVKEHPKVTGIFVGDKEGNVYPVVKVLSASETNDLAILKIDTKGKKLKALELADTELIGEDVYVMGHPFKNYYFMAKGMIARRYVSEHSDENKIAVTAEFGQGASGGPVVNTKGQLVGVVSATYSNYTNGSKAKGDLQLVTREVIPVSILNKYVKQK